MGLLESDVAFSVIESLKNDIKEELRQASFSKGKINEIIAKALPTKLSVLPKDQAEKELGRFNYMEIGFKPDVKDIRIVDIEGFDKQACGGTHIANTKEIGKINIVKLENKGKDNRRMYFELVD